MSVVLQSTYIETVRYARVPAGPVPRHEAGAGAAAANVVTDIARYETLPSLQALALAIVAAVVTTALFLVVL
ncbi:hypothetical protein ACIQW5_20100 [Methylorubrum thiocyanatum]|uniref:hypothetical protein n=1 Tax=Methylorubrum thiocyanatum TaxID=47958 RepID=UPI00383A51B2